MKNQYVIQIWLGAGWSTLLVFDDFKTAFESYDKMNKDQGSLFRLVGLND